MKKFIFVLLSILYIFIISSCTVTIIDINYTYEEHYQNVSEIIEKKYMYPKWGFTSFELYPIYNEKDEHEYFLVEFEPYKFFYVRIKKRIPSYANTCYYRSHEYSWSPYHVDKKQVDGRDSYYKTFELDEFNNRIIYNRSHFKQAGVENEKLYFLKPYTYNNGYLIPAVKRGDKFLNLISMEEFDYKISDITHSIPTISYIFDSPKDEL